MALWRFHLADFLEARSVDLREKANIKYNADFCRAYGLKDRRQEERPVLRYNYYGPVNFYLLDDLIASGRVQKDDCILDVGCGTGMFLFYMAAHGYLNLSGQELDPELYNLTRKNQRQFLAACPDYGGNIEIRNENAVTTPFPDDVNFCYLFNSFYDQTTYEEWLAVVHESLKRRPRHLTIALLYPTPSSIAAFRRAGWLKESGELRSISQIYNRYVRFLFFESY